MAESLSSCSAASSELVANDFELTFDSENHGRNIKVMDEGLSANKVKKSAKEALVVTNRPLVSNELFEVLVGGSRHGFKGVKGEMKAMLKGKESVRIGVTVHCPSDLASFSTQHSLKRMTSGTWMMMSECIVENGETVKSFEKYNLKEISLHDRVGIVRVPEFNGSLIIYINGAPIGIIATAVPDRVYGFVELQGECEKVSLTRNRLVKHEALPIEIRSMRDRANEIHKLHNQLGEREEEVMVLNNQMEILRKQLLVLRQSMGNGSVKPHHAEDGRESRETQTMQMLEVQQTDSRSSSRRRQRKRGCIIC